GDVGLSPVPGLHPCGGFDRVRRRAMRPGWPDRWPPGLGRRPQHYQPSLHERVCDRHVLVAGDQLGCHRPVVRRLLVIWRHGIRGRTRMVWTRAVQHIALPAASMLLLAALPRAVARPALASASSRAGATVTLSLHNDTSAPLRDLA